MSGDSPVPIYGVAIDAGSGLAAAIKSARGARSKPGDLLTFKRAVVGQLGQSASTVLVDAQLGPDLLADFHPGCAPMMAFEADVYKISDAERITVLPDSLTVADFSRLGVKSLKFFMYYAPDDKAALNKRKEALVAEVGALCAEHGLQYLFEPLVYHRAHRPGSAEFARAKPELVQRTVAVFSQARFGAHILKIEVPVDLAFVEGFGTPAMSRAKALDAFRAAAAAADGLPIVYLSAGVPFAWFEASLRMAAEAGVALSGFMCGRSIWSDAIGVFGAEGDEALRAWLASTGVSRLNRLILALEDSKGERK